MAKIGNIVLQLPPETDNPRNSEGAFIELKDGRTLFAYSRFLGHNNADDANAAIAMTISSDKGETWSKSENILLPEDHGAKNIMSVSLLRMQNGDIGLYYLIRYGWHDTRLHLRRSSDEGNCWGKPICCIPGSGYYVTNNDRVVRLSSGRLIIPTSFHKSNVDITSSEHSWDGRGIVYFYISDDDGYTWQQAMSLCALNYSHSQSGLQEPGIIELKNGSLWAWARTDLGRQYEMFSVDDGNTWTAPAPSAFTGPCSPLSMKRIPHNGNLVAIWNPIPNYQTKILSKAGWGRTPFGGGD